MLTSFNGVRACPGCSLYAASKHGIIGLIESLGMEYATTSPVIRVNGVAPGMTNTFLVRNQARDTSDEEDFVTETDPRWIEAKPYFESILVAKRLS